MNDTSKLPEDHANRDPITGEPGAHPVGTGVGAAVGGAAAGAAVGSVAGPLGTAIGTAAGAVVGGLAGKAAAEEIDPTAESAYWRENYAARPYVEKGARFDDYSPAYEYGVHSATRWADRDFDDVETDLSRNWDAARGKSSLSWERARHAARDAWNRVRNAL